MGIGYGKKKESGPREWYANWGGWCPDPVDDPELFMRLPAWRQTEIKEIKRVVAEHPEARAFLTIDPGTGQPYPGQVLIRDLVKQTQEARKALPEVPNWYKYDVPNGVPVALLRTPPVVCHWTPEQTAEVMSRLEQYVTPEALLAACKSGSGLTPTKPVDGLFAFIWRITRFNAGLDVFTPVTCFLDLADGLGRLGFHELPDWESLAPVLKFFQKRAEVLADEVDCEKYAAAQRYAKVAH